MNLRAQASVEFVAFLAISVILFSIIFMVVSEQITTLSKASAREKTLSKIKEIANAIDEVYLEGAGAKRYILVSFPNGVENGSFRIVNKTVVVRIFGTDVSQQVSAPVPDTTLQVGNYYLEIVSYGNAVSIGIPIFSVSPSQVNLVVCSSSGITKLEYNLTFSNNVNQSIAIDIQKNWTASDVNLTVQDSLSLNVSEQKEVPLNFSISPNTIGTRSGKLIANTSTEISNYTIFVPIYLNVESCGGSNVSYILVETYRDAAYTNQSSNFSEPLEVVITTEGWLPYSNITLDLKNSTGASIPGYPKVVQTNEFGKYNETWIPTAYGNYTVISNYSTYFVNSTFVVESC